MQNIPDPASVSSVHPQSFKTQLKKLSGTTTHRKAFKTGNVLDAVAVNNKGAEVKPQASKAKRFAGEEVQENVSDSVQNDAINNAESVTHSSNSVHIASLSTDELSDKARTYNTSFESQADTIVSQVSIATPVSTSVASATPSFSLAGMGAGLGALALGGSSGGSSGGGAQTTAVTTTPKSDTPLALSGFIAAGPMVNNDGLKVEVFDVNGNRLASTNSVKDGTFTINLKNTYTGILKVVVSDTNGEAINFIDEANGKSKSLGTDLITIFNLLAGEKNLNINVNTLTTEAANKVLTVSNDLTKVTNADISKANLEIATKYGLIDKSSQAAINPDLLITSKPGLIIDLTGAINQGFNAYGLALAVKSVLDDNPSMTIKDACKSLAENPLYAKSFSGPTDWASAVYKFGASFLDNVLPTGSSTITVANDQPISQTTTITQGQVLRATSSITDIDGIPTSGVGVLSYKWQSSSVSGGGWSDIAGATASTFTTTQAQVGKYIRAVATYTDNFGTAETVESAPTDAITYEYEVDPLLIEGTSTVAPASQTGSTQSFAAGDVNGDGISDWIYAIGGPMAGTTPALMKREMYVMFGDTSGTYVLNTANPDKGFPIQLHSLTGEQSIFPYQGNRLGYIPRIANDFNGDGKGEIIVGTFHENLNNKDALKNRLLLVDQANRNPDANKPLIKLVNFDDPEAGTGYRASDSGDINGDGFSDLIIGNQARRNVNIIYGKKNFDPVNYNYNEIAPGGVLPANFGFNIIDSIVNLDIAFGWAVSALGDVNGDGYGDMAIANSNSFDPTLQSVEEVFVIFGKQGRSNANIDVNSIRSGADNTQGYVISMDPQLPFLANNMSFTATKVAGDFNGDGLNDFVFEGHSYDHTAAKFYVVFGKQSTSKIRLDELGTNGFSISLPTSALRDVIVKVPSENDYFGDIPRHTAANCGDFNGDGIDDMLISLIFNTRLSDTEKTNHFLSYVVYGKAELGDIDLNDLGNNGFKVFEGTRTLPTRSEFFGNIVPVGDINADGLPDLVFDDYFGTQGGTPTVIFGSSIDQPQPQWKVTHQGFDGSDTLASSGVNQSETFIAGAGQDTIWGKGGADVIYAGAGNDVFYLNADNISKLSNPMQNNERLARVDGGGGLDTLALDGSYINVDLTAIANARLQSIEIINLGGNNKLKLSWQDIQNMSAMNLFNDATSGWSGFSSNTIRHHQLLIDGSATDSVDFLTEGGWVKEPTTVQLNNGESIQNYNLYTNTNHTTQLLVNTSVGTVI